MARDLSGGFKHVTAWLLIGTATFVGAQWWLHERDKPRLHVGGGAVELQRRPDGHFHWPGRVNGVAVDFLVDTGATRTALPAALAARAGVGVEGRIESSTANGTVRGGVGSADVALDGGVRVDRLRVAVLPALEAPLLGMDVLAKLHFAQRGGVLRLEPAPRP